MRCTWRIFRTNTDAYRTASLRRGLAPGRVTPALLHGRATHRSDSHALPSPSPSRYAWPWIRSRCACCHDPRSAQRHRRDEPVLCLPPRRDRLWSHGRVMPEGPIDHTPTPVFRAWRSRERYCRASHFSRYLRYTNAWPLPTIRWLIFPREFRSSATVLP